MSPSGPSSEDSLRIDSPCRGCRYNLRGQTMAGRCPECGTPVSLSVRGDALRYSDPRWVATLWVGARLDFWGTIAGWALIAWTIITSRWNAVLSRLALGVAVALLNWCALWLITIADPSGIGEEKYGSSRRLVRIMLPLRIVATLLSWFLLINAFPLSWTSSVRLVEGILALSGIIGTFAFFHYLQNLVGRIPDDALQRRAQVLMWLLGLGHAFLLIIALISDVGRKWSPFSRAGIAIIGWTGVAVALVLLAGEVIYLIFLTGLIRRLHAAARAGRVEWKEQGAA